MISAIALPDDSYFSFNALAALANSVILPQSPISMAFLGVSQEPPTQATFLQARNCDAVSCEIPPVGQNVTSPNGPAIAFNMPIPPAGTAGNNFNWRKPASRAAITSDGVITPGSKGRPLDLAAAISAAVKPGDTPNPAPT